MPGGVSVRQRRGDRGRIQSAPRVSGDVPGRRPDDAASGRRTGRAAVDEMVARSRRGRQPELPPRMDAARLCRYRPGRRLGLRQPEVRTCRSTSRGARRSTQSDLRRSPAHAARRTVFARRNTESAAEPSRCFRLPKASPFVGDLDRYFQAVDVPVRQNPLEDASGNVGAGLPGFVRDFRQTVHCCAHRLGRRSRAMCRE